MKILHTSDWHIGRTLHRVARLDEARAALLEVAEIAEREKVDAIVVCGDIFENLSPTAEAEQVVYEALERFCGQGIQVVLITGNHDHPGRWRALAPLLRRFNVHVVDDLRPADKGGIVELHSRDGKETLQVAAVPWVSERRSYAAADLMGLSEKSYQSYADAMSNAIHTLCQGFDPGKCHMLAGHIFITGSVVSESERTLTIGEIYAVTPSAIPTEVQYAALGHVHKAQKGPGVPIPCRYSGSLLQLDFGETGQQKSVAIVDLEPGTPAKVKEVPLQSGRKLRDVSGSLADLAAETSDPQREFLRVSVECDGPQPGLSEQVRELFPNALSIKLLYPSNEEVEPVDVRSKSPKELFAGYLQARYQKEPPSALLDAFVELFDEASTEGAHAGQISLEAPYATPADDATADGLLIEAATEMLPVGKA